MQSCTRSNDELVMEMQHTYEEQQSNVDDMIRQVALLTEMMKEIHDNRTGSEMNGNNGEEEGVREAEEEEPTGAEQKSEALLEETEAVEVGSDEKETLAEEESMTTPPDDGAPREFLEEAHDEPQEKEEEAIERDVELGNTLFYFQPEEVHVPNEKVEEFTTAVKEESTSAERPPPVIDKSEGCCYEESEPEIKDERSRRNAARTIYWVQLQPWPEPRRMGKPPYSGLRPKENKKVQGTYKHHKKKRDATLVMIPPNIQWVAKREVDT